MTGSQILLIGITTAALALIVSNKVRADLVALLVALALGITRLLTPEQALAGFSNSAVITIVGLFVITAALERTGVVQWLADRLALLGGGSELRIAATFMAAGAVLSLVMNNIAAGAVLLPAAVSVARRAKVPASKVLIPLAYGTLFGGMATLFTTANIILSGNLEAQGQRGLTMVDFLPTGGLIALAGIASMLLAGRHLLPRRESVGRSAMRRPDLTKTYQLAERLWEVRVGHGSPLIALRLSDSVIGAQLGITVLGIWRGREAKIPASAEDVIADGDILLVLGREERVRQLENYSTTIGRNSAAEASRLSVLLGEVLIAPRSQAIGQTLKELRFRSKFAMTAVAIWREGRAYRTDVGDFELEAGDALLLVGPAEQFQRLAEEPGFIVLDQPQRQAAQTTQKAPLALLITAGMLALAALRLVPTPEAMLAGAALLVITGCMNMEEAYRAIEWRVVVLIAGMLPVGTALVATGLSAQVGGLLTSGVFASSPLALVGGLFVLTVALTQFVGGQVASLIIGPIAVSAAMQLGISPQAVAVAVSIACSTAFLTPIAHPVNVLMMGPGGYSFGDFVRAGALMTAVTLGMLLVLMPLLWGVGL
ncbi:SLC13 family permease [Chloroflexia bacterium SDU3-3]|nr:SLC13 family permease [Chloroflexia bacterium SDU3-3]